MKGIKQIALFFLLICTVQGFAQKMPDKPNPPRLVNDYTNTLSADQRESLEQTLVSYDTATSNQIAVVIIPSTNGDDVGDYAVRLGNAWGVGNKGFDNGVVLLVAKDDHKVFIAPGNGLESKLSDFNCKAIIETEIIPSFKQGDYYRGIVDGTNAIMEAGRGEYEPPPGYATRGEHKGGSILPFIIMVIIIIFILSKINRGGGGNFMSRRGSAIWWLPSGGGGWSGGGGGGFGGGGGGGFGGFGGGGFGGGGAGGSW